MQPCPCGSTKLYPSCCGAFISGAASPNTPEELMRSRYTAYTMANIDYIAKTMRPPASNNFNAKDAAAWAKAAVWQGLKVIHATANGSVGTVEFIASFREQNKPCSIHEVSEFRFIDGAWYYTSGQRKKS